MPIKNLLASTSLLFLFSLPVSAAVQSADLQPEPEHPTLHGGVSLKGLPEKQPLEKCLGTSSVTEAELQPKHKPSIVRSTLAKGKSLANFVCDLRGFDWSKEAANAISDTNIDPKNADAREYLLNANNDRAEYRKSVLIMQLALNIDRDTKKSQEAVTELSKLIGPQQAIETYKAIEQINCANVDLADPRLRLDFEQKQQTIKRILEQSSTTDPALLSTTKTLAKYNHRGKVIQATAKVVYSTMGVAAFTPTLVAPLAEATLLTFMMATGGPEQDKLLKEVYLAKILQSRCNLLSEKAHLVVDTMDMALLTNNKRLLVCTRVLLNELTDEKTTTSILGETTSTH